MSKMLTSVANTELTNKIRRTRDKNQGAFNTGEEGVRFGNNEEVKSASDFSGNYSDIGEGDQKLSNAATPINTSPNKAGEDSEKPNLVMGKMKNHLMK